MTSTAPRSRGRHRTDLLSLFSGVFFIAAASWWAGAHYFDWEIDWNLPRLGWFAAGGLILLGLLGILASLRRDRPQVPAGAGPQVGTGPEAPARPEAEPPVRPEPHTQNEPPVRPEPLAQNEPPVWPEPAERPTAPQDPDGEPRSERDPAG